MAEKPSARSVIVLPMSMPPDRPAVMAKDKRDKNVDFDQAEYTKYQHRQDDGVKEQVHQGASFGFLEEGNCGEEKLARASLF